MSGTGSASGCGRFRRHPRTAPARRCPGKRRRPAPGPIRPGSRADPGPRRAGGRPRDGPGGAGRLTPACVEQRNGHPPGAQRNSPGLAEVDELQREAEIVALDQGDHGLQVVFLLRRHAQFLALHLGADALGPLIPDQLGDLSRVILGDALLEADAETELLPGRLRVTGVQGLERHTPPDQLVLEDVEDGIGPVLAVRANLYGLARPGDAGPDTTEVEPGTDLLGGLVQGVVHFLLVDSADDVEE